MAPVEWSAAEGVVRDMPSDAAERLTKIGREAAADVPEGTGSTSRTARRTTGPCGAETFRTGFPAFTRHLPGHCPR